MKRIGICFLGIVLSFGVLSILDFINVNFTEASEFAKPDYLEKVRTDPSEDPYSRLAKTIWRFDWIFQPTIVAIVSIGVSFLDRSKFRILLSLIAVFPLLFFNVVASSFSASSFLFTLGYLAVSVLISWAVRPKKSSPLTTKQLGANQAAS